MKLLCMLMFLPFLAVGDSTGSDLGSGGRLTCELEQSVAFGGSADFPNGPAYFGMRDGKGLDLLGKKNVSQREINTQAGIDNFVTSNYEASFVIEMKQGRIRPIPFNASGRRIVDDMPSRQIYVKILSPGMESYQDAYYSVGYFSNDTNTLVALLMIQPQQSGARIFSLIDLGRVLFGYCYARS